MHTQKLVPLNLHICSFMSMYFREGLLKGFAQLSLPNANSQHDVNVSQVAVNLKLKASKIVAIVTK